MRPALAARAGQQSGLVTRAQARAAGYTERELRTLTKPLGEWYVVRRGVYLSRASWELADPRRRHRLQTEAALLNSRDPAIVSHASAAVLHGLSPMRLPDVVHLTRPGVNGGRTEHGVSYHPASVPLLDRTDAGGIVVTAPARTALDVAREDGYLPGLVVADQVLRDGTEPPELLRVVGGMKSWPHVTRARAVAHDADGRAESPGETLTRALVLELGLGPVEPQHEIVDGTRRARADLRLGCHLIEFDGRVKYARVRPYADNRPGEDVLWEEKRREDWIRSLGYGLSRVVWAELLGPARERTLRRLRAEINATIARVGERAWLESLQPDAGLQWRRTW